MASHTAPALVLASALAVIACGGEKTSQLIHTDKAPASQGEVQYTLDQNGNLKLKIQVRHLARPEDVSPDAKVYVIWSELPGGAPRSIGALRVDGDLAGRLEALAPRESVSVFITAETSPEVTTPTGPRVLSSVTLK